MTEERYLLVFSDDGDVHIVDEANGNELYAYQVCDLLNKQERQIELLNDELEQCKAVINNRWSEYLKKKGVIDDVLYE